MEKQGVCIAIYILTIYIKAKEELWKIQIFSPCKNIIFKKKQKNPLKKNPLKRNQNPSRYH
jgi:hypothetical protein